jgi:two-component system KDP operon response regulator KdpE
MPTNGPLVMVIEDEAPIRRFLRASLTEEGYRVEEATSGEEGIKKAMAQPPDIVILDLGLPGVDGHDVLRRLREWLTAPVIILSARDQEKQKVEALDAGADDYLTKPFGLGELLARMRTALRHTQPKTSEGTALQVGDLNIDLAARTVTLKGEPVHLTPLEYKLLVLLMRNAGKVLTHRQLLRDVWGPHDVHENHYIRVFVATLRRKVEPDPTQPRYILTEQGVGYRFAAE